MARHSFRYHLWWSALESYDEMVRLRSTDISLYIQYKTCKELFGRLYDDIFEGVRLHVEMDYLEQTGESIDAFLEKIRLTAEDIRYALRYMEAKGDE